MGSVIQRAPFNIPMIEKMDETILNQLRSTRMPSSFSKMFDCEPVQDENVKDVKKALMRK